MTTPNEPPPNEPRPEPPTPSESWSGPRPGPPPAPGEWPTGDATAGPEPATGPEPFAFRLVRSVIAPNVLGDGGHDAPLSDRGRLWFRGTIAVLVVAIAILFIVTLARR